MAKKLFGPILLKRTFYDNLLKNKVKMDRLFFNFSSYLMDLRIS